MTKIAKLVTEKEDQRVKCNNLVLSRNATFILQSKTIQSILEQVYHLAELVESDLIYTADSIEEGKTNWIKILNILEDIKILKKYHLKQIATIQGDALDFMLDEVSPKYRNKLIKDIDTYRQSHMKSKKERM